MPPSLEPSQNLAWVLLGAFLVMFMQAGFALVETGFTRARNAANTMAMNLVVYPVGALGFWLVGYGLMLGGVREWPSLGGAAAGSHVVHMTGGVTALAGALVLGPRLGKYRADGTVGAMPGHNLPMSVLGTFVLAFGWFGFNAGSTLSAADPRIALVAVNTMLASSAGVVSALLYVWATLRKPDVGMACNGLLGGLVAITASCAFVSPAAAVLIGVAAGVLVVVTVQVLER